MPSSRRVSFNTPNTNTTTFWQFGCWNDLNSVSSNKVLESINKRLDEGDKPDFLVISGDNYYPDKIKEEAVKTKVIYPDNIRQGIVALPKDIPILMVLGNHDLETTQKKNMLVGTHFPVPPPSSYVSPRLESSIRPEDYVTSRGLPLLPAPPPVSPVGPFKTPPPPTAQRSENKKCEIIQLQLKAIEERPNIDYFLFKKKKLNSNTLLLMIDTGMYETDKDANKYLPCYNTFLGHKNKFDNINDLRSYQLDAIKRIINRDKDIQFLIIVGHHPIYQVKSKNDIVSFVSDIAEHFIPVLNEIDIILRKRDHVTKYYYLCSDLHLYQKGVLKITNSKSKTPMKIHQYIVGTGGTQLDNPSPIDVVKKHTTDINDYTVNYELEEEKALHGFLKCTTTYPINPRFKFVSIITKPVSISGGINHKKRKTKRYKKKSKNATMKLKYKMKY